MNNKSFVIICLCISIISLSVVIRGKVKLIEALQQEIKIDNELIDLQQQRIIQLGE